MKARRLFYILRSRIFYAFKNFATLNAIGLSLATLFVEPVSRLARAIAAGSITEAGEIVHGYSLLWLALPRILSSGYLRKQQPIKVNWQRAGLGAGG